jgi:hypothetical protein
VPQALYDAPSRAASAIERAEKRDPSAGPFRVHRPTVWHPFGWFRDSSRRRLEDIVAFERDSLQPLFGLPLDLEYTFTLGILEPESHLRVFRPWLRPVGRALGGALGLPPDQSVLYFPRRAFDLWNTRYFIVPVDALDWRDENRAYASLLEHGEIIAPDIERLKDSRELDAWRAQEDWQVLRNRNALPRAWIVHDAQIVPPLDELDPRQREARVRNFLHGADSLWNEPGRPVVDPRKTAWIESTQPRRMTLRLREPGPEADESVRIVQYSPQRVELAATLAARGLVILADADAPGWKLFIDGAAAPILRANLGMRAALVEAGTHRLSFRYESGSFLVGAALSGAGLLTCGALLARGWPSRRAGSGRRRKAKAPSARPESS